MGHKRSRSWGLISGAAIGAGLMYLADPDRGNRRRSFARDKIVHVFRLLGKVTGKGIRDLVNRTRGIASEAWCTVKPQHTSDQVLLDRVRARIGRTVSHPSAIEVRASNGRVVLAGLVLESEADDLMVAAHSVPGVREVESRLEMHQTGENVPGLQGGSGRMRSRPQLLREKWAPGTRLLAGAGGAIALALPTGNRSVSLPRRMMGALLFLRAVTNLPARRIFGLMRGRRAIRLEKTITIHAPVERVFEFWSHPENFARVMEHVQEIQPTGENRFRWTVLGPAGTSISWTSQITRSVPNQLLVWRSAPGSTIRSAGIVRFQSTEDSGTRIHLLMSYHPPAGALGHAVAALFGVGPKSVVDEDLVRVKSLFEHGKTTAHGERVTREQFSA
jgi:uncharacterized membrane protein